MITTKDTKSTKFRNIKFGILRGLRDLRGEVGFRTIKQIVKANIYK